MVISLLLTIAGMLISFYSAAKDGLSSRYDKVGWLEWHQIGWLCRDIPLFLILVVLLMVDWTNLTTVICLLFIQAHQNMIYTYYRDHADDYEGSPEMPEWFRKLRELWRWLIR